MTELLTIQFRVIGALVLREARSSFGNTKLGYLWTILSPAFGVFLLVMIFSAVGRSPSIGTSFALFFATGIMPFQAFVKINSNLMTAIKSSRGLLTYPMVKETDIVFSKYLFYYLTFVLVMLMFFNMLIAVDMAFPPQRLETVLMAFTSVTLLALGAGMTNAVIFKLWSSWQPIEAILSRPLFFISGILYIPSEFPSNIVYFLSWNPILHGIEWFREGYYGYYTSSVLDKSYLLGVALTLLLIGFTGERVYRKVPIR
ncbi:ABC transporter permease [Flexibacterium corallicola]|uniref:ABC transporter permease n=1 Tax=Flexibacterium corallicola TaxID=3037259 RepID=UPI00286ED4D5|nr:ABC transporter permease [Pseudovibrio sp. M1P-2-3]